MQPAKCLNMKRPVIFLLCLFSLRLAAHTFRSIEATCPLDGTRFQTYEDSSGTSFGARLDLRKIGPIADPWSLSQCPTCQFPLFRDHFSEEEKKALRKIVKEDRFKKAVKGQPVYFALGVIKDEMQADPYDIGWIFLQASWEVEHESDAQYQFVAKRAMQWFDQAAKQRSDSAEKQKQHQLALYLPIELSRRIGDFKSASQRLAATTDLSKSVIEWLPEALKDQRRLIEAKDKTPHNLGEKPKK